MPNASGGVCAPPVYQILRAFKYSNRVFKSPTPCLAAAGKHITGSKSHSIRDYRIRCANLQLLHLLHLRLCHRQDNMVTIGLDEAAEEEGEECAECSVGEEGEGEGEEM